MLQLLISNKYMKFQYLFLLISIWFSGCSSIVHQSDARLMENSPIGPEEIVQQILKDAAPKKQPPCWRIVNEQVLHGFSPYLSSELYQTLDEWMKARDRLSRNGGSPEGAYDPLTYRKWQPEKETIGNVKYDGDLAQVSVHEVLASGKIRSGHRAENVYFFSKKDGKWKLYNIKFKGKYIASKGGYDVDLLEQLREDIHRMKKLSASRDEN